jgi:GNS1/SUR4 family
MPPLVRRPLIAWNFFLALFSFLGAVRTVPHLLYTLASHGMYTTMCAPAEPSYGNGPVGLWTCLFVFSKLPELIDTVFLVLRKKPVIFLHWYHHISGTYAARRRPRRNAPPRLRFPRSPLSRTWPRAPLQFSSTRGSATRSGPAPACGYVPTPCSARGGRGVGGEG